MQVKVTINNKSSFSPQYFIRRQFINQKSANNQLQKTKIHLQVNNKIHSLSSSRAHVYTRPMTFFCQYNRTPVSANELSLAPLFDGYCPKNGSNIIFDVLFLKISWFLQKNGKCLFISFYKNKFAYKLHLFAIKTDIKNVSKSRDFKWEKSQN